MIISGKHIQSDENNIYTKLSALFSEQSYVEITPLQSDLFDAICGSRKLLGKKIAEYPDQSISFFIALIKEGEAATVINQQKEIEEITAPDGSEYFNQAAIINISNDTIYYATIDRFSEYDIKYFLQKALNISTGIEFINIAGWLNGMYAGYSLGAAFGENVQYPEKPIQMFRSEEVSQENDDWEAEYFSAYAAMFNKQFEEKGGNPSCNDVNIP